MKFSTLNKFTLFVNDAHNQGQTIYKMIPIPEWWSLFFRRYSKRDESTNDIEILFKPNPGSRIGHYVCVYYDHQKNAVFIYDPLYVDGIDVHPKVRASLEKLYPSVKGGGGAEIVLVKPGTTQPDNVSCGLFSIAYATALIFGLDPKDMKLNSASSGDPAIYLRKHLEQIYRQRRITPFPMDSSHPIASSLSSSNSSTNSEFNLSHKFKSIPRLMIHSISLDRFFERIHRLQWICHIEPIRQKIRFVKMKKRTFWKRYRKH